MSPTASHLIPDPEVLVVGAGPTGVTLAMFLADQGVRTLVIDKRTQVSLNPRARGINARGAEFVRLLGAEQDLLRQSLRIVPQVEIREDLGAPPMNIQPTGGETFAEVSPCEGITVSQDVLEGVLREHAGRREDLELRLGCRMVGLAYAGDGAEALVTIDDGRARTELCPAFVVGADGWRSEVRHWAGIGFPGTPDLSRLRGVLFRADLTAWLGDPPPALVRLARAQGILLPTHADHRWALHGPSDPERETAEAFLARVLGVDVEVDVLSSTEWIAAVGQAEAFRRGNVFLAGDAAHRVTPAGGTGVTNGMADAANLAWKLAATLRGWGGPRLLDSYGSEREPVARMIGEANRELYSAFQEGHELNFELRWLEFGYRYVSDVVCGAESPAPVDLRTPFAPSAQPGDRAPHVWLDNIPADPAVRRSTIDLGGAGFVVLTDSAGAAWVPAAAEVSGRTGVPLSVEVASVPEVARAFALSEAEAVLLRPDSHIAWRSGADSGDPTRHLTAAVRQATGWGS